MDKAIEAIARGLCDGSPFQSDTWQDYVPEAKAALAAYHAHLAAEGLAIVPVEPCENMRAAGANELFGSADDDWGEEAARVYRAMIDAHQTRRAALDTLLAIDGELY